MRSEEVKCAFFVAVAYTDDEMAASRLQKIDQAAQMVSSANHISVRPVIIDARRKLSASKLKATSEQREQLRKSADSSDG
jgi:hypothetical protein